MTTTFETQIIKRTNELITTRISPDAKPLIIVETGSFAQGYAAKDSDHDIKTVYVRPKLDYLTLWPPRDNFESISNTDGIDISGWDIAKFLKLMRNSNPQTFDWLHSPLTYFETDIIDKLRALARKSFSQKTLANHYLGITKSKKQRITGKHIPIKSYLTLIINTASLDYVLEHNEPAPIQLPVLLDYGPYDVREVTKNLLTRRRAFGRDAITERKPVLDDFVNSMIRKASQQISKIPVNMPPDTSVYDSLFLQIVEKM